MLGRLRILIDLAELAKKKALHIENLGLTRALDDIFKYTVKLRLLQLELVDESTGICDDLESNLSNGAMYATLLRCYTSFGRIWPKTNSNQHGPTDPPNQTVQQRFVFHVLL